MEAVFTVVVIAVRLSFFHLIAGFILAWILQKQFSKYSTKKWGFPILLVSIFLTYFILCYQLAAETCAGRPDFGYCSSEVMILGGKMGIVFIPLIFIFGFIGFSIGMFLMNRNKNHKSKKS